MVLMMVADSCVADGAAAAEVAEARLCGCVLMRGEVYILMEVASGARRLAVCHAQPHPPAMARLSFAILSLFAAVGVASAIVADRPAFHYAPAKG